MTTSYDLSFARHLADQHRSGAEGVHRHPQRVPRLRSRNGRSTATWTEPWTCSRAGQRSSRFLALELHMARAEGRTPLLLMEIPGRGPGHRVALRPSRQAAPHGRMASGPGTVDAGAGGRQTLRPWRRRRRLRHVRGPDRHQGAEARIHSLRPLRGASSRDARKAAASTSPTTSTRWRTASAHRIWLSAWTRAAATTSGCGSRLRLRGVINATLSVSTLTEGVHSGAASGIVPSSFRILRGLLGRLEDEEYRTRSCRPSLHVDDPAGPACAGQGRGRGARYRGCMESYPFQPGATPVTEEHLPSWC